MNALQWALLILGAVAVIALVLTSRRERRALAGWQSPATRKEPAAVSEPPATEADAVIPAAAAPRTGAAAPGFDEFGVGKPRRRPGSAESRPAAPARVAPSAAPPAPKAAPKPAPPFLKPAAAKPGEKTADVPELIIALYIAEYEGTKILGPKIHAAVNAQGLRYEGKKKAYDRMQGDKAVFSVTSLTAPGHLDPADAAAFSTPGLALFMRLPGPAQPAQAFRDMLATAHALSQSLKAVVFDADHKPLTDDKLRALAADVDEWARRNPV